MPRYDLDGRTVLITGSTGGLGTAVAHALRQRGANLALLDLDADVAQEQAAELGPETVARGWAADVRDLDSLRDAVDAAAQHFGRIDVVIANAGIGAVAPLETMEPEAFERIIDINLSGVWRTFRATLPHVKETRGYLLAVSSMAAFVHSPLNGPYVASKAGVGALCDATRLEVRHHGIKVGSVYPTFFQTPMMDDVHADPAATTLWGGNKKGLWKNDPAGHGGQLHRRRHRTPSSLGRPRPPERSRRTDPRTRSARDRPHRVPRNDHSHRDRPSLPHRMGKPPLTV